MQKMAKMQMNLQFVVQRADACAESRAETFAERRAVPRADVRAELCAENRLNESFCPVDVTYCVNSAHIWLNKVQNCADAETVCSPLCNLQSAMQRLVQMQMQRNLQKRYRTVCREIAKLEDADSCAELYAELRAERCAEIFADGEPGAAPAGDLFIASNGIFFLAPLGATYYRNDLQVAPPELQQLVVAGEL